MIHFILSLIVFLVVHGLVPLRKHHYQIQSPIDEITVIYPQRSMTHLYTAPTYSCGHASLSCMAFGYSSAIPVRCGILEKAPLCQRMDPITQKMKCDAFCDTDGSGRLCQMAFTQCCERSVNGCTSSKPRQIILYDETET